VSYRHRNTDVNVSFKLDGVAVPRSFTAALQVFKEGILFLQARWFRKIREECSMPI
jgi:hypothetical protein